MLHLTANTALWQAIYTTVNFWCGYSTSSAHNSHFKRYRMEQSGFDQKDGNISRIINGSYKSPKLAYRWTYILDHSLITIATWSVVTVYIFKLTKQKLFGITSFKLISAYKMYIQTGYNHSKQKLLQLLMDIIITFV